LGCPFLEDSIEDILLDDQPISKLKKKQSATSKKLKKKPKATPTKQLESLVDATIEVSVF
jgi:hypothetical protein